MSTSRTSCCIRGCSNMPYRNSGLDPPVKFYRFPESTLNAKWIIHKRKKWINAVKNYVKNSKDWEPNKNTRICSAHFVNNQKSENPLHPSYIPTIFPGKENTKKCIQSLKRFERLQQRQLRIKNINETIHNNRKNNNSNNNNTSYIEMEQDKSLENETQHHVENNVHVFQTASRSITCQTDEIIGDNNLNAPTYFFCNINCNDGVSTAAVQVNISINKTVEKMCEVNLPPLHKNVQDVGCDPIDKDFIDLYCQGFHGITSIKNDESLSSLTGVNFAIFSFLLNILPDSRTFKHLDKKTKLLITLMKLKTGLTFTALGVLFNIHRSTAQRIFLSNLQQLNILTKTFIFWPSKATVRATLPETFKKHYPETRVIIDCTEVNTEIPPEVKERVLMYSEYKHHYTVKFTVGCTPNGFISFVSKCYGGRASDSFITNDCGLVNLIEPSDVVLTDKGFPQIKTEVEKKNAVFVMPPFCHDTQFTSEEVEETYT